MAENGQIGGQPKATGIGNHPNFLDLPETTLSNIGREDLPDTTLSTIGREDLPEKTLYPIGRNAPGM